MNKARVSHHIEHVISKVEPTMRCQGVITLAAGPFSLVLRSPKYVGRSSAEQWNKDMLVFLAGIEVRAEIGQEMSVTWGELKVPVTPEEKQGEE